MALGRISGPLLKSNLLRNGVDLAFETSLLYLDVTNRRVGINTNTPSNDLQVNGTTRTTDLNVSGISTLGTISFTNNSITTTSNQLNFTVAGSNPVVYQGILQVGNLQLTGNTISNTQNNGNIVFTTTGSGAVTLNSNLTVNGDFTTQGNLTVGGNITVTGNIQIGDQVTDTIAINAGVTSNILPAATSATIVGASISNTNPGILTFSFSTGVPLAAGMFLSGGNVTSGTYLVSGSGTTWTLNQAATGTPTTATASYNLGSPTLPWANIYANLLTLNNFTANNLNTANLTFSNGTITNTVNNQDINFVTSGSGGINIGNFKINGNTITNFVPNQISNITQNTATTTFTASIATQPTSTFIGSISGSTLTVTSSPSGSGIAVGHVISGTNIPTGTYIIANLGGSGTSSTSQWTISSYLTQASETITAIPTLMTVTGMTSGTIIYGMSVSGVGVTAGTRITAFVSGAGGTGTYYVTPNQDIASTTMTGTITGYVNIGGTNGVVIPAGTTLQRPGSPIAGMIRFNSDPTVLAVEIFNGATWTGVAGIQSGITVAQATDIALQWALTLG